MPSAAYIAQRDAFGRSPQWIVEIELDRCSLTYTTAPCTAIDRGDGNRCFYSFQTCQDPANFTKTTKTYRFALNDVVWPDSTTQVFPLLRRFVAAPQKVHASKLHTDPERVTIRFALDYSPPPLDHDKGSGKHNTQRTGEFWRVLKARHPNWSGRTLRIKRGFNASGFALSDFEQIGPDFRLKQWDISRTECLIVAESPLAKLSDRRIPSSISNDNTVQTAINTSDTALVVRDASEYPDPAAYTRNSIYVEIESEICKVTTRNTGTNTLTIVRAQWGTTAASHAVGKDVRHVICIGANNGASAPTAVLVTEAMQDMLEWAGIASSQVDTASFSKASQLWPTADVEGVIRKPISVAQALMTLREPRGIVLFINSTRKFAVQVMSPDLALTAITEDQIVDGTVTVDEDDEARLTRASLWYNPTSERTFQQSVATPVEYGNAVIVINTDLESTNNYGDVREETFLDYWVDSATAHTRIRNFARRLINRRRGGVRAIKFELEIKSATLEVGDGISLTTSQVLTPRGVSDPRPCIVVGKREVSESRIEYEVVDLALGGRFFRISPDTASDDYDTATAEERNAYGYWGDSNNRCGDIKEPGYIFW